MHLIGPSWDIIATVQNVIDLIMDAAQLVSFTWLLLGGVLFLVRQINFYIDGLIINFISAVYGYFEKLLSGTMFNETVVDAVMKNVYIFIGVIVFFRLALLILKYIVSPELVQDGKLGADKLVKRVIIGMIGIIAIPTVFTFATDIQAAFLKDQVIQRIIIPEDILEKSKAKMQDAGKYIGTYVWAGFVSPATKAPKSIENEYKSAIKKGDLSSLDINDGAFLGMGYDVYNYSYFILLSTFVLGYVLYLMIKYCLDLIGRLFKLFLYQLIAPIAMIEYMINGADDGVFKSWKNAVLGTYFLLFVRVFALWFVIFVMTLMTGDLPNDQYVNGSLLQSDDYLLRALIIVALLAFMMDLPKLLGNIFGIDLEQEGSAGSLLNSIKGGFGKALGAGLAFGGAAVGGIVSSARNLAGGAKGSINAGMSKKASAAGFENAAAQFQSRADKLGSWKTGLKSGMGAFGTARGQMVNSIMGANQYTSAAYSGYKNVSDKVKSDSKSDSLKRIEDKEKSIREKRELDRDKRDSNHQEKIVKQNERSYNLEIARMYNESKASKGKTKDEKVEDVRDLIYRPKMDKLKDVEIEVDGIKQKGVVGIQAAVDSVISSGLSVDVAANLVSDKMGSTLDVPPQEVYRIVKDVYDDSSIPQPDKAKRIVNDVYEKGQEIAQREATVVVNQVEGHRVMDTVDDAVQTVHRDIRTTVTTVENLDRNVNETININGASIADSVDRLNTTLRKNSSLGRENDSIDET